MAGSFAVDLPEALDFVEGYGEILGRSTCLVVDFAHASEMQRGIEKHRRVARRKNKTISVRPRGIERIVGQEIMPKRIGNRSESHGRAGMTGVGLLHGVDRESADSIDTKLIEIRFGHGFSVASEEYTLRLDSGAR